MIFIYFHAFYESNWNLKSRRQETNYQGIPGCLTEGVLSCTIERRYGGSDHLQDSQQSNDQHEAMDKTIIRCLQVGLVQLLQGSDAGKHWFYRSFSGRGFHGDSWDSSRFIPWYEIRCSRFCQNPFLACLRLKPCGWNMKPLEKQSKALRNWMPLRLWCDRCIMDGQFCYHDDHVQILSWHSRGSSEWVKWAKNHQNWRHFLMSRQCAGAAAAACTSGSAKDSTARDPGHQKSKDMPLATSRGMLGHWRTVR